MSACIRVCEKESVLVCVNRCRVQGGAAEGENLVIFCIFLIISFISSTHANKLPIECKLHQIVPAPQDGSYSDLSQACY